MSMGYAAFSYLLIGRDENVSRTWTQVRNRIFKIIKKLKDSSFCLTKGNKRGCIFATFTLFNENIHNVSKSEFWAQRYKGCIVRTSLLSLSSHPSKGMEAYRKSLGWYSDKIMWLNLSEHQHLHLKMGAIMPFQETSVGIRLNSPEGLAPCLVHDRSSLNCLWVGGRNGHSNCITWSLFPS